MSRFDYIEYDEKSKNKQHLFKAACEAMELHIYKFLESPRAKSIALTKLEEMYSWVGKAIRDDQIKREEEENGKDGATF